MALDVKQFKFKILSILPLILLFFISLNGSAIINISFFSANIHYILVYYWVLRQPDTLGYGFIFLAGIITDVVLGLPLGVHALSLLAVAGVASYARFVTVRATLVSDWISFVPALILANLLYFLSLFFSEISINYFYLLRDTFFTFLFYPILWVIFTLMLKLKGS